MIFKPVILLMTFLLNVQPVSNTNIGTIVYFYSSTCGECLQSGEFLDDIDENHEDITVIKFNIGTKEGMGLFNIYCDRYNIDDENRFVPIAFLGKNVLIGYNKITRLENEIDTIPDVKTPIYKYDDSIFLDNHKGISLLGILAGGFINGLNPCSFAMYLFLFSLFTLKKERILKIACAFLLGKFITFLLLGTVLFRLLSYINISLISRVVKTCMLVFIILLIILNLSDYISSKKNAYGKIKLQLPKRIRRFNHALLKKTKGFLDSRKLILIVFLISIGVSLTEFLCTGQIYLVTLITLLRFSAKLNFIILLYLIIYNLSLILPLFLTTVILYKGQDVFSLSERVRKNMSIIKLINAAFLLLILLLITFL